MKNENWDSVMIEKAVNEYLEDLPNREEFIYKKAMLPRAYKKAISNKRK